MNTIAFMAGLAVGTILGFLFFLTIFWLAKHLNEVDGPEYEYYDEDDD